nr:anthrone oxygenase family protein [Leptolyngbya sp. FACHB-36]
METVDDWLFALKLFSALGCGLIAGVFFAFSAFVMNALARLQPAQGIAAMQSINITVINPLFMTAFLGTAAACLVLSVFSLLRWHQPGSAYLLVGSLLYFIGTLLVTIVLNVPLNDALAIVQPDSAEGASF